MFRIILALLFSLLLLIMLLVLNILIIIMITVHYSHPSDRMLNAHHKLMEAIESGCYLFVFHFMENVGLEGN